MLEWAQNQSDLWQFIVIFIIAFAPWMDVSIVVPIGVVWGLPPIGVAITAFTGNFLLVLLLGLFFKQFYIWREKRRKEKGVTEPSKKEKKIQRNLGKIRHSWSSPPCSSSCWY